jgi:electron transfer flavoprotein beta subunit
MSMNIIVCIKRVPDLEDAEITISPGGMTVETDDMAFGLSEWDSCAVEEAIQIREAHGGLITAVTVGDEDTEEVLRRALAMGVDRAVRPETPRIDRPDAYETARLLAATIAERNFDLALTGSVSGDTGEGVVGGMLAAMLNIPQVALATSISVSDGTLSIQHEVENGLERIVEVDLPALVTVQTGINEPRYVSIRGIRKVSRVEISKFAPGMLVDEPWTSVVGLSIPTSDSRAEILEGNTADVIDQLIERLKEQGGI